MGDGESRLQGVVAVQHHEGYLVLDTGNLCSFQLLNLHIVGVLHNVLDGGGKTRAVCQLDNAVVLQQEQGAGFVGGVVGDCDLNGGVGLFAAAGENTEGENCREGKRNELFHDFILPFLDFDII